MNACPKCAGYLVREQSLLTMATEYFVDTADLKAGGGHAVRCVNCGYFSDPVMLANRARQVQGQRRIQDAPIVADWASSQAA